MINLIFKKFEGNIDIQENLAKEWWNQTVSGFYVLVMIKYMSRGYLLCLCFTESGKYFTYYYRSNTISKMFKIVKHWKK